MNPKTASTPLLKLDPYGECATEELTDIADHSLSGSKVSGSALPERIRMGLG